MIESFDSPDDESVKEFWMQACHSAGSMGSGTGIKTLSGWLTAFCYWTDEGKKTVDYSDEYLEAMNPHVDRKRLILDAVSFPVIGRHSVPKAVIEVPIRVKDYDDLMGHETTVIAGFVGMKGIPSDQRYITKVQPMSGWWMLEDEVYPFEPE